MKISITTILLLVTGLASAQSMPTPSKTRTLETIKFEKILSWEDQMPGGGTVLADGSKVYPRHSVIEFYTLTNGCTTDNSFEVEVKQGKKRQKISVFRVVKDMCKGVTRWIKIEKKLNQPLAWEVPVAVANPFPAEFEIVY